MKRLFLSTCAFLFSISSTFAQEPQSWLIYFGNTKIADSKFAIHHELQLRDHQLVGDHNQTLVRLGLQYQLQPAITLTAGYGYIHNEAAGSPNNPFTEQRIYQELLIAQPVSILRLRHRFRLEERFIEEQAFRGRLRYCLFMDIPLTEKKMDKGGVYAALYDELFINAVDSRKDAKALSYDRNRLYAGVGYKVQQGLGLQLGYMRQQVNGNAGTNHILLSVHHNIKTR